MSTRHFLLTHDNAIEEFTEEQASQVAEGKHSLPRFADKKLRYVQVDFDDKANSDGEIHVRTLGAVVTFDDQGHMQEAGSVEDESDTLSHFEHDACVQFALKETVPGRYALN